MKVSHITDMRVAVYTSAICGVLSMLMVLAIGLRFFNPPVALFALVFMAVSPMELAIARRGWQDNVLALFGLGVVFLACELSLQPKRRLLYIPFVLLGTCCILIKESGIVVYGLCGLWLMWMLLARERSVVHALLLSTLAAISLAVGFVALAYTSGGPGVALEAFRHLKESVPANVYAINYQNGPWYNILEGLWILVPSCLILSTVGALALVLPCRATQVSAIRQPKRSIMFGLGLVLIGSVGITMATPNCQNIRYISFVYGLLYLISGFGLWTVISIARTKLRNPLFVLVSMAAAACLVAIAASQYRIFRHCFIDRDVRDLSTKQLVQCMQEP